MTIDTLSIATGTTISFPVDTKIESRNTLLNNLIIAKPFLMPESTISNTFLNDNVYKIAFEKKYEYRPDLVAFDEYGIMEYYPAILLANSLGSLYQFDQNNLNNEIFVPTIEFVQANLLQ